ncbi:MAG: hypothetical protein C6W57_06460 [Caldibacillus debilis]|nr:MAG: hypothetical protein C6W57_06460 [Caldibacillus debilis]
MIPTPFLFLLVSGGLPDLLFARILPEGMPGSAPQDVEPFWIGRRLPDKTLVLGDSASLGSAGGVSAARFGESTM